METASIGEMGYFLLGMAQGGLAGIAIGVSIQPLRKWLFNYLEERKMRNDEHKTK